MESSLGGTLPLYSVNAFRYCAMSKDCATHFKGGEGRLHDVLGCQQSYRSPKKEKRSKRREEIFTT